MSIFCYWRPSNKARRHVVFTTVEKEPHLPQSTEPIPRFPPVLARAMNLMPLPPLSLALTTYARKVALSHPGLFRRLGEYSHTRFVLDPTDLPFAICLEPNGGTPSVTVTRGHAEGAARIAGPLAALLGLVHGAFDGDALFFSRDLVIEGETGAALALRNAVDDAELDLFGEISQRSGPFAEPLQHIIAFAERRTGVCLTRPEEIEAW
ncbi:MAG: sterol-binding protein [Rhodobacteraceae bacterium]|nr:sterol-binding protein [Paracoccaceae bacterium]